MEEAQAILRRLQQPARRSARYTRPTGILSTVWHYCKQLFSLLFLDQISWIWRPAQTRSPLIHDAYDLLSSAAELGNAEAHYILANALFYGQYGLTRNYTAAYDHYTSLAANDGNSTAQNMLGFYHSTGLDEVVEQNQAKAMIYHTFAADAGNTRSQMTMAYRHSAGIGTPRNCEKSVGYYKLVADKAIQYARKGPPGGRRIIKESYRLADNEGGVYGDGASVTSAGQNARQPSAADSEENMDNYLEYLDLISRKGDLKVTLLVGQYHYEGSRTLKQDFGAARECFQEVARRYWTRDGKIKSDVDRELEKLASKAAGYLGSMFLRGEGVKQNFDIAKVWFRRGIENGDALSQHGLGLMHLHGLAMDLNPVKAADFFGAAADQDVSMAQVRLGALLMDQGDLTAAIKYFEFAARNHNMEGFYYLAELTNQGIGRDRSCTTAALYYKIVAEKVEAMHSDFAEANEAYDAGEIDTAILLYMQAAEQGYESAQSNVAYLLDRYAARHHFSNSPLWHRIASKFPAVFSSTYLDISSGLLALTYWTRSAAQKNVDSLVKMGDYYLTGVGANSSIHPSPWNETTSLASAPEKAAACYVAAAETQMSAQALWNLGWMHEHGLGGLSQDFHLAKRHYDLSFETNAEAYLPVTLALMRLRVRSWWNGVTGGAATGINEGETKPKTRSISEWFWSVLDAELNAYDAEGTFGGRGADGGQGADRQGGGGNGEEWDAGAVDDLYGYDDLDEDGILEGVIFAGLAAALAVAVWYRHNVVRGRRRDLDGNGNGAAGHQPADANADAGAGQDAQAPAAGQQGDRGMFPAPGDPDYANWAAGGIGH